MTAAGEQCVCAGKQNKFNEGGKCAPYSGYSNERLNGVWCYADVNTCADARANPGALPGYGTSLAACKTSSAGMLHLQHCSVLNVQVLYTVGRGSRATDSRARMDDTRVPRILSMGKD